MSELDKALALASLGLHVFPVRKDKTPMTQNGFKAASTDEELIRAWWRKAPSALVGVATGASGLVVLDVDVDKDKDGFETLAAEGIAVDWEGTYGYWTRRGGYHAVYKAPDYSVPNGADITLEDGRKLHAVDRRADGGYVVWWGDPPDSPDKFTPAPSWLITKPKSEPVFVSAESWKNISGIDSIIPKFEAPTSDKQYEQEVKTALYQESWQQVYAEYIPNAQIGKRTGVRYFIRCPLPENHEHGDEKKSATIDPDSGLWNCHKCHAGGDLITFAAIGLGFDLGTYQKGEEWGRLLDELGRRLGVNKPVPPEPVPVAPDADPKELKTRQVGSRTISKRQSAQSTTEPISRFFLTWASLSTARLRSSTVSASTC